MALLPSGKLTQTLVDRGWKTSFDYKLVSFRVYVNLPGGNGNINGNINGILIWNINGIIILVISMVILMATDIYIYTNGILSKGI